MDAAIGFAGKLVVALLLPGLAVMPLATDALGHSYPGYVAQPVSFGGISATVGVILTPYDITAGQTDDVSMQVSFFDTATGMYFDEVVYRIEIYRSGDLLARSLFYDADGTLDIEIRPVLTCDRPDLWQCTEYFGERHTVSGGFFAKDGERPVIQGPIFDRGGLYNIRVTIESVTDPEGLLDEPPEFNVFAAVAQEYDFLIQTVQAREVPIVVKTYYDDITAFDYSAGDDSISFEMPFDWSLYYGYFDPWSLSYHSPFGPVHQDIGIPKDFGPYAELPLKGYVNGVEVDDRVVLFDPYSHNDTNRVIFLVTARELERISRVLDPSNNDPGKMIFRIVPQSNVWQPDEIAIPSWVKVNAGLWSGGQIDDSTFVDGIQYMIREGIITVPDADLQAEAQSEIPSWIRLNAQLWSEGHIDDQIFARGLQWMAANGIITV